MVGIFGGWIVSGDEPNVLWREVSGHPSRHVIDGQGTGHNLRFHPFFLQGGGRAKAQRMRWRIGKDVPRKMNALHSFPRFVQERENDFHKSFLGMEGFWKNIIIPGKNKYRSFFTIYMFVDFVTINPFTNNHKAH